MIKFPRVCFSPEGDGGQAADGAGAGVADAAAAGSTSGAEGVGASGAAAAAGDAGQGAQTAADPFGGLSAEAQHLAKTKGWKSPNDIVTSYANLEKLVGADKVALPGKDAKPEEFAAIYDKLGRPETPDKYDLGDFKVPEGLPWDIEGQKAMIAGMHARGLNSQQVQGQLKDYAAWAGQIQKSRDDAAEKAPKLTTAALQKEWGADFAANMDAANVAAKEFLGDDLEAVRHLRLEDGTLLGDNLLYLRGFANVGKLMSEPTNLAGLGSTSGFRGTPAAAKGELETLKSDQNFQKALTDAAHPEHEAAVQRQTRLYAAAYPEQPKNG